MAFPSSLQKLPSAEALSILVNMNTSLLSRQSIAVKSALVLTWMSPFSVLLSSVLGLVACLSCSAWQCHNSKSVSSPSHQIIQGKKRNCPCTICDHVLLSSSSVLSLSHGLLSRVVLCAVCPSPSIIACHTCIQSSNKVWKFWCRNACVFLAWIVWKSPFPWRKQ